MALGAPYYNYSIIYPKPFLSIKAPILGFRGFTEDLARLDFWCYPTRVEPMYLVFGIMQMEPTCSMV